MDKIKYVECCEHFGRYMEELPNDQHADPGYRHIRLEVTLPGTSVHGNMRVRFCPWCGKEFTEAGTWPELPLDEEFLRIVLLQSRISGQDVTVEPYKSYSDELEWRRTGKYTKFIGKEKTMNVTQVRDVVRQIHRMEDAFYGARETLMKRMRYYLCSHKHPDGSDATTGVPVSGERWCDACKAQFD